MTDLDILRDLVLLFAVAVIVVGGLRKVGLPSIAGFIVAGVLLGPGVTGLISDPHDIEVLAEVGVVLLLFGVGLELPLDRVRRLWRLALMGGALQVGLTILLVGVGAWHFGLTVPRALFAGFVVAISSTAVVLRGLQSRGEIDAPHGRLTVGILLFQDLCVVPMMLLIPLLAGTAEGTRSPLLALLEAAAVLIGVLVAARLAVPWVLRRVAATRERELFVLTVSLICLATAWAAAGVGASLALGAFLAGLVVAGSEFRHQALSDLIPFREVLTSIFFVSVGMLLEPGILVSRAVPVLAWLAVLVPGKFLILLVVGMLMRLPPRVSLMSAVALAQVGEFAFILLRAASGTSLIADPLGTDLFAAIVLSLALTPLLLAAGPHLAAGVSGARGLTRVLGVRTPVEAESAEGPALRDHVVIAGYGLTGRELARSLRRAGLSYLIVDLNPENVRQAMAAGEPALYGDVTSPAVVEHLALERAKELVLVINDPSAAERALRVARAAAPDLPILVRARYAADVDRLRRAGASEVIAAELEAAVEVTGRILARQGVADASREEQARRIRAHSGEED